MLHQIDAVEYHKIEVNTMEIVNVSTVSILFLFSISLEALDYYARLHSDYDTFINLLR